MKPRIAVAHTNVVLGQEKEAIKQLICSRFVNNCQQAVAIAICESGLNPKSVNEHDSVYSPFVPSVGLFMHHEGYFKDWDNATLSTDKALAKFKARGWKPWTNCAKKNGLL